MKTLVKFGRLLIKLGEGSPLPADRLHGQEPVVPPDLLQAADEATLRLDAWLAQVAADEPATASQVHDLHLVFRCMAHGLSNLILSTRR